MKRPRLTEAEIRRSSFDRVIAAELAASIANEENVFLRARVAQLEARLDRMMKLLKDTASRLPW